MIYTGNWNDPNQWYVQHFSDGTSVYFLPAGTFLKNGNVPGRYFAVDATAPRRKPRGKTISVPTADRGLWTAVPESSVPTRVLELTK